MSKVIEAPFADGSLLEWDGYSSQGVYRRWDPEKKESVESTIEMRKIEPFNATMVVADFRRGRSAAQFIWKDEAGNTYPMFMRDMVDLLKNRTIESGKITDTWIVQKRGANYGIRIAAITQPKRAPSWRSAITCRKCGRTGSNNFKYATDGYEAVPEDSWSRLWGQTPQMREKYLKDETGNYIQECEAEGACAKRAKKRG